MFAGDLDGGFHGGRHGEIRRRQVGQCRLYQAQRGQLQRRHRGIDAELLGITAIVELGADDGRIAELRHRREEVADEAADIAPCLRAEIVGLPRQSGDMIDDLNAAIEDGGRGEITRRLAAIGRLEHIASEQHERLKTAVRLLGGRRTGDAAWTKGKRAVRVPNQGQLRADDFDLAWRHQSLEQRPGTESDRHFRQIGEFSTFLVAHPQVDCPDVERPVPTGPCQDRIVDRYAIGLITADQRLLDIGGEKAQMDRTFLSQTPGQKGEDDRRTRQGRTENFERYLCGSTNHARSAPIAKR